MKKTAIVTGGGSGIGWAICQKFIEKGIKTIIIGRSISKLQAAKSAFGNLCEIEPYDLNDLKGIPALITRIRNNFGPIDIIVNNAGINLKKEFTEVTDEEFQQIILTNVTSVFSISREVVKAMLENKIKGNIINISSMASQYGLPKVIGYTASKAAIEGMTRAMATELSPKHIRINCIAPGFIATDMSSKALDSDPERKARVMNRTPMGHLGNTGNIADAVAFLISDEASYKTGVASEKNCL